MNTNPNTSPWVKMTGDFKIKRPGYKILVACEKSQRLTIEFRRLGYEAYSCDIDDCTGGHPEWHIKGDAITEAYKPFKYQLMVCHPPCTFMSKAGARWMYPTAGNVSPERLAKAMEAKEFFLKLFNAPTIPFISCENPVPLKVVGLPIHDDMIQPYQFGDPFSKKTLLWLRNLPKLKPTNVLSEYRPYLPSNTGGKKRGQSYMFKSISQEDSSKTFEGIAKAMAIQYTKHIDTIIFNDNTSNRF